MQYPQNLPNLNARISSCFSNVEVRNDIDEAAANEDDLRAALLELHSDLWNAAASQIEDYDRAEKSLEALNAEISSFARWDRALLWTPCIIAIAYGCLYLSLSEASGTTKVVVGVPLVTGLIGLPAYWIWLKRQVKVKRAREKGMSDEMPLRLEATHKAVELGIVPNIRSYLSSLNPRMYGDQLPQKTFAGLADLEGSQFEISTGAREKVKGLIGSLRSASIGISGPRGAGKTTLLSSLCQSGKTNARVLALFTSAPVLYDAREFLLYIFASLCSRIIEKESGVQANRRWRQFDDLQKRGPTSQMVDPLVLASGALLVSLILFYLAMIVAQGAWWEMRREARTHTSSASTASQSSTVSYSPSNPFDAMKLISDEFGIKAGTLTLYGIGLFAMSWVINASQPVPLKLSALAALAWKRRRMKPTLAITTPDSLPTELVREAVDILRALRIQQTYSSGWSGSFKFPIGVESSTTSSLTWAEKQLSLPELVDEYRIFLGRAASRYNQIIIAIDELDKLSSDELAEQFLNGIKAIFGQSGVFYLVSVSQNAMSTFERRGLPFRDVFDSSFDDVLNLDYLDLNASTRVIGRRVVGLPHPFICFCHCMSGGLPRDLIRQCRALFEQARVSPPSMNGLAAITSQVILKEVSSKVAALAIACQKLVLDSELFQFLDLLAPQREWNPETMATALQQMQDAHGLLRSRLSEHSPQPEDFRKLMNLYEEARAYLSFLLTIHQLFYTRMDESSWQTCLRNGTFDRLARVRQMMSANRMTALANIEDLRSKLGLPMPSSAPANSPASQERSA